MVKYPHIPLTRPSTAPFSRVAPHLKRVAESGFLTNSVYVRKLEDRARELLQVPHAVAVSSATSGLMLVAKLLDLRGEVILPSFTFFATAVSLLWNQLTPVFCDCDDSTYTIDPDSVEDRITRKTSAILGVHVFGCPANIRALTRIADKHNLKLIFDSAHGFGASYHGTPLGGNGDAEVFSLTPTKLAPAGEGGIITTRSRELADQLRIARDYGNPGDYDCVVQGMNARLCEWSAVFGWEALRRLPKLAERRRKLVARYQEKLADMPGIRFQQIPNECVSSYKDLSLLVIPEEAGFTRDQLAAYLKKRNIDTRLYFYPPVHQQTLFRRYHQAKRPLPVTEYVAENIISIPLYSHQKVAEVDRVAKAIREFHRSRHAG